MSATEGSERPSTSHIKHPIDPPPPITPSCPEASQSYIPIFPHFPYFPFSILASAAMTVSYRASRSASIAAFPSRLITTSAWSARSDSIPFSGETDSQSLGTDGFFLPILPISDSNFIFSASNLFLKCSFFIARIIAENYCFVREVARRPTISVNAAGSRAITRVV